MKHFPLLLSIVYRHSFLLLKDWIIVITYVRITHQQHRPHDVIVTVHRGRKRRHTPNVFHRLHVHAPQSFRLNSKFFLLSRLSTLLCQKAMAIVSLSQFAMSLMLSEVESLIQYLATSGFYSEQLLLLLGWEVIINLNVTPLPST